MKKALVMELVDIADLKSVGFKPWEFESPRGHQFYAGYPAIDRRGYLLQLGDKCYGSTSGSNPLGQGSIP